MARVLLEDVSKSYAGGVLAVNCLNLQVEDQEFLVLVGPSGCGKSTTLRLIAGLEQASGGTIRIGERVVNDVAPKDRDIAMAFQNYALYPHMSVYRNMAFGLELRYGGGWWARWLRRIWRPARAAELAARRQRIPQEVHAAARILGIEHLLDRMPRQLSGGERQRVALGRAIVRQPAAFLFDEPLSNLDAQLRVEMRRELKQLHQGLKATMVYVTHDQIEALTLGDRIAVMYRGTLQQVGPPMEVYRRPCNQFVAGFIGSPPMNFVTGRLDRSHGEMRFAGRGLTATLGPPDTAALADGQPVVLGVRPEHLRLSRGATNAAFEARVAVVESLGDAALVHLTLAAASDNEQNDPKMLVSKMEANTRVKPGDVVGVAVDSHHAHLFDSQTGENLMRGPRRP